MMNNFLESIINSNFLIHITVTLLVYSLCIKFLPKLKQPILSPLPVSVLIIAIIIKILNIPLQSYTDGTSIITSMLGPMTVVLALPIYRNIKIIKEKFDIIFISISVGVIVACVLTFLLAKMFNFSEALMVSILTKSVTTPISLALTEKLNGIRSLSVLAVVVSGITGAVIGPTVCKIFKISSPVAIGLSIGTASHAFGTSKALEIGEREGAFSSLAIGVAGVISVVLIPLLFKILSFVWLNFL